LLRGHLSTVLEQVADYVRVRMDAVTSTK